MGDKVALIIVDRFTGFTQAYPAKDKSAAETMSAFQRFLGPQVTPKHVYTDGSREFRRAMQDLKWSHDTSTPHHSESNAVSNTQSEGRDSSDPYAIGPSGVVVV